MAIRRFHQKSRAGCSRCKVRRVKCDEGRPTCKNCVRQSTECIYGETPPARPTPPRPVDGTGGDGAYDALDLQLMHRFATVTALGLSPSDKATHVWKNVLPVTAHAHPLLMHGVLALAGMDLARVDTESRTTYRTRALHHQQLGLSTFQELLAGDASSNIQAVFPFSLMLIILAYASVHSEAADWSVDAILDLFMLFSGPRTLALANWTAIRGSELLDLLRPADDGRPGVLSDHVRHQLQVLKLQGRDDVSQTATKDLAEAIEQSARGFDLNLIGRWPSILSEAFFARLRAHQPEALVILSHYSIVLAAFRERWWVGPWDRVLLAAVARALPEAEQRRYDWSVEQMESVLDHHAESSRPPLEVAK